ncbi:rhomboid protein 2 [Seiridium cupressi]
MPNIQGLSTLRARSYVFRLPLFTRAMVLIIVVLWLVGIQSAWDLRQWGALIPDQISITTGNFGTTAGEVRERIRDAYELGHVFWTFDDDTGGTLRIDREGRIKEQYHGYGSQVSNAGDARANPYLVIGTVHVPTWTTPLVLVLVTAALVPSSSLLGHLCGVAVGYLFGLGYLKFLAPPEKVLRWIEGRLNLLGRLPHYVSVDQKTYGRFGVLPTSNGGSSTLPGLVGSTQRLGP